MSRKPINLKILKNGTGGAAGQSVNNAQQLDEMELSIDRWITYCKAEGLSDESIRDYNVMIDKFYWWYIEYAKLGEKVGAHPKNLTTDHAIEFIAYLKEKQSFRWGEPVRPGKEKLSPASVATYARTARTFFNWLEERKIIQTNPFNRSVKLTSKKDPIITRHHKNIEEWQLGKIFEYLTGPGRTETYTGARDLAIISLLLDSGMRRGELISMQVKDLDWQRSRVTIRGKTGERICFFSKSTEEALLLYNNNHRQKQKSYQTPASPFWLLSDGNTLTLGAFDSFIRKISNECGFRFSAHKLRHTFATVMVSRVGIYELKELLGHSSLATTQIYTHGSPDKLQESYRGNSPLSILDVGQVKSKPRRGRPRREQ